MKASEKTLQAAVMLWAMSAKQHQLVIPNSNTLFRWEADLITVTRSGLAHEYEMKVTPADYKRDAGKTDKHRTLKGGGAASYFWYVTCFDIAPPQHAGWLLVYERSDQWLVEVKKEAPRLCDRKIADEQRLIIARLLSWRLTNYFGRFFTETLPARANNTLTYRELRHELNIARQDLAIANEQIDLLKRKIGEMEAMTLPELALGQPILPFYDNATNKA